MAQKLGLKSGDKLELRGIENRTLSVTITGLLENGTTDENAVLLPLNLSQKLLGLEGRVQSVKVSALTVPENALSKKHVKIWNRSIRMNMTFGSARRLSPQSLSN